MLLGKKNSKVLAYWYDEPTTAEASFSRIAEFLVKLHECTTLFDNLHVIDFRSYTPVRSEVSAIVAELVHGVDYDLAYLNKDSKDRQFSLNSYFKHGFTGNFTNQVSEYNQTAHLSVRYGGKFNPIFPRPNIVNFDLDPVVATPDLLRLLFKETILFWRPSDGLVTHSSVLMALDSPFGEIVPGWLTYIADPAIMQDLPPDIVCQPFADGALIQAADHPGTEDDPEYLAHLVHIRDTLRSLGYLSKRVALSRSEETSTSG